MTDSQLSELTGLAGLKESRAQLEDWLAVVRAERAREDLGMMVSRPTWKNLVFTGGPGTGKSYAARAVASAYADFGFLRGGQVLEAAAAGMAGWTVRETRQLVNEAIGRAMGRMLMITGAQAWRDMQDGGAAVLAALYEEMTAAGHGLALVLSGEAGPVGELLGAHRPLAARFAAVVSFPGYEPSDLGAAFARLADEAGFTLGDGVQALAANVLAFEAQGGRGSARLAVDLLSMATVAQARRIAVDGGSPVTITAADIPDRLDDRFRAPDCWRPGQYL
ncbi:MAG TPA: AAA family ATPase [Streptosporangiaceae bacterium]|nr:AAA family ATPase [Streptosporangiaceae bacterium]